VDLRAEVRLVGMRSGPAITKWTALYARSPKDLADLKKNKETRNLREAKDYAGDELRLLRQHVRDKRIDRVFVNGLDQFPDGAAALLKLLWLFADNGVAWKDVSGRLSAGDGSKGYEDDLIQALKMQDAKKRPKGGRGRPREELSSRDQRRAEQLKEHGAPLDWIQTAVKSGLSKATLSRRLQDVNPPHKPSPSWQFSLHVAVEFGRVASERGMTWKQLNAEFRRVHDTCESPEERERIMEEYFNAMFPPGLSRNTLVHWFQKSL